MLQCLSIYVLWMCIYILCAMWALSLRSHFRLLLLFPCSYFLVRFFFHSFCISIFLLFVFCFVLFHFIHSTHHLLWLSLSRRVNTLQLAYKFVYWIHICQRQSKTSYISNNNSKYLTHKRYDDIEVFHSFTSLQWHIFFYVAELLLSKDCW